MIRVRTVTFEIHFVSKACPSPFCSRRLECLWDAFCVLPHSPAYSAQPARICSSSLFPPSLCHCLPQVAASSILILVVSLPSSSRLPTPFYGVRCPSGKILTCKTDGPGQKELEFTCASVFWERGACQAGIWISVGMCGRINGSSLLGEQSGINLQFVQSHRASLMARKPVCTHFELRSVATDVELKRSQIKFRF